MADDGRGSSGKICLPRPGGSLAQAIEGDATRLMKTSKARRQQGKPRRRRRVGAGGRRTGERRGGRRTTRRPNEASSWDEQRPNGPGRPGEALVSAALGALLGVGRNAGRGRCRPDGETKTRQVAPRELVRGTPAAVATTAVSCAACCALRAAAGLTGLLMRPGSPGPR